jgi:endonuclease/exonuclease/phosphatase family metal-dependent hydrolase
MAVFLFWNAGMESSVGLVGLACREHSVDILILAESQAPTSEVLHCLNAEGEIHFSEFFLIPTRLRFFHRLPANSIRAVFDDGMVAIRVVRPPLGRELLVVACHLASKLHSSPQDQYYLARKLRRNIVNAEKLVGHQNSIVLGDLNMNPFEEGMNAADGLHAVMDKQIALKKARTLRGEECDFFYNPMWSRLGDESDGPTGTYYRSADHVADYYWHTFDQVLLRPSLLPFYKKDNLKILTQIAGKSLLGSVGPKRSISDHLPLLFSLDTEREA